MTFKAGVYGTVAVAKKGEIAVKLDTGNFVIYKHNSECDVKIGDKVTPTTPLGKTGNIGANGKPLDGMAIHLHIQAVDAKGRIIDPDQAFLAGRREPKPKNASLVKPVKPEWVDVGPIYLDDTTKRPKVVKGVVKADAANQQSYYRTDITAEARRQAQEAEEQRKRLEAEFNKKP
jgi:murein DD-endopeptidase MepM/ murein hydrolase activator NlpD